MIKTYGLSDLTHMLGFNIKSRKIWRWLTWETLDLRLNNYALPEAIIDSSIAYIIFLGLENLMHSMI